MTKRKKTQKSETDDRPSTSEVLFPVGSMYELANGDKVEVLPWSIEMLGLMSQHIPNALEIGLSGVGKDTPLISLLPTALDEIVFMVAKTVGWSEGKVRSEMNADDLLGVAVIVFDVCVAGPMGKVGGLATRIMGMLRPISTLTLPSSPPSSS